MKNNITKIAKLPIVLGIILFLGLGSLIVYAATNASDVKSNDLQVGILKGDVDEEFETPGNPDDILTGVPKKVWVQNNGDMPFFVRVMLFPEIITDDSKILPANIGDQIEMTISPDWIDGKDGYYYYKKKVEVGEKTSNLIETVKLVNTTEDYKDATFTIYTKSETVTISGDVYLQSWWGLDSPTKITAGSPEDNINKALQSALGK